LKGSVVAPERPEAELKRLLKEQHKARQDEVFGGFSPAERAEYEGKADRIHALESEIQASAVSKRVRCLQRQSRNASGTKNPKHTLLKLRLISPTAAEKKVLPIREGSEQSQK
jgi:hypothetical protein